MITFENVTKKNYFLPMYNLHGKLAVQSRISIQN